MVTEVRSLLARIWQVGTTVIVSILSLYRSLLQFCWRQAKILSALLIVLALAFILTALFVRHFSLELPLPQAFEIKSIDQSAPTNGIKLDYTIKGKNGDTVDMSILAAGLDQEVNLGPSEEARATPKTLEQIKAELNQHELDKLLFMAKMPSSVFGF